MPKTIPTQATGYLVGEWMVRSIIGGRQYQDVLRDQHRTYADRGNRVAGLFPIQVDGVPYFETDSTTYTQTNDLVGTYGELVDLSSWSPWMRLGRRLQDTSNLVVELEVEMMAENADISLELYGPSGFITSTILTTAAKGIVRHTFQLTEAAASGGTIGQPLVQFGLAVLMRVTGGTGGTGVARLYEGPVAYERMLETTDAAKLPRGY